MDQVILVDENDIAIGLMEKMEAHRIGALHRAFSILLFNSKGEMLIQKRAKTNYHSGGLWTNACCSHPIQNENIERTVSKRLLFEMGINLAPKFVYKFTYKTSLDQNLIEYEVDHVFKATFDGVPSINKDEVEDWKFIDLEELRDSITLHPHEYTYWFKLIVNHAEFQDALAD
jgi:isopentenyl-diphosphate Delta-isomerase